MDNPLQTWLREAESKVAYPEEEQRLQRHLGALRETLGKDQRKLLLHVLDDQSLIGVLTAEERYAQGFRQGVRLMIDCLYPHEDRTI